MQESAVRARGIACFKGALLLLLVLLVVSSIRAQGGAGGQSAISEGTASANEADSMGEAVDAYLRGQMKERRIPGMQVAVVRQGRVLLLSSYGVANLQTPVPVDEATVFSINSITKAFTGIEVMKLVQRGKLRLDSPVSTYLDGLPEAWRRVSIRQLATHMSGLPDINRAPGARSVDVSGESVWDWVMAQPVRFVPGERFDYCQTNYTLLQRVINKLKGRPPDEPLAIPQFEAVGMASTRYGDSTELIPNGAAGYGHTYAKPGDTGVLRPVFELFRPISRASSGMYSTAKDMARWMIAIQQEHILNAESLQTMWTPASFNDGQPGLWGIGWEVLGTADHPIVGMTGGGRSAFFLYPKDDLGIVILTNLAGSSPEDIMDRVAAIYGVHLGGVAALRAEMERQAFRDGPAIAAALMSQDPTLVLSELEMNDWGYRLLASQPRKALEILKIVPILYPKSGNAYDSLGEAYAAVEDRDRAIASYRKSLELDPKNTNAARWLERLGAGPMP